MQNAEALIKKSTNSSQTCYFSKEKNIIKVYVKIMYNTCNLNPKIKLKSTSVKSK